MTEGKNRVMRKNLTAEKNNKRPHANVKKCFHI